jgi:predicted Zn-dependent protease
MISYGLLKRLQNESELAGVLGHEIAHVVQKHQLKAIHRGSMATSPPWWAPKSSTASSPEEAPWGRPCG